mmetsp:Transcript_24094/g.50835  ORF Transcript_24094/g.50835 Transcript_24094/m.50835 type:complete len:693 (-) Transcript_24094:426-2504(-)|eukprot:CAMPEP_0168175232 /NCGR_PEP_ID=MMETSP0139_2-20121125/6998_1 /TAXON_ID=44445 /ORGANISM="Pseudo-nitzschia australis, Strain 10249 10 AB" /LENGTH=692 /DNA_ID=CAMNT_0008093577 /DNA_START=37 /DNA_END=2115 /DNA_ORIENTATION=-
MSNTLINAWTKGPADAPLYSDWRVSFTTNVFYGSKDDKEQDSGSVSTESTSSSTSTLEEGLEVTSTDDSFESNELPSEHEPEQQPQDAYFSIHRNMIGPKSVFFTETFLNRLDHNSNKSVILLPSNLTPNSFESVVEAFQIILEYCYRGEAFDVHEVLTTGNALSLFCLCNYFGMDSEICCQVCNFIKTDLNQDTVALYYQTVKDLRSRQHQQVQQNMDEGNIPPVLNADPIMDMVVTMCYHNPSVLDAASDLSKIADWSLWSLIGSMLAHNASNDTENDPNSGNDNDNGADSTAEMNNSKIWSQNITHFFETCLEDEMVDLKGSFGALTANCVLPEISEAVALRLLEHEFNHGLAWEQNSSPTKKRGIIHDDNTIDNSNYNSTEEGPIDNNYASDLDNKEEKANDNSAAGVSVGDGYCLTDLQKRCIKALCNSNWAGEENEVREKRGKLSKITTPGVLEALLIESVSAGRALDAKIQELEVSRKSQQKLQEEHEEKREFWLGQHKFELAKHVQKQMSLQNLLDKETEKRKGAEQKLNRVESRAKDDKKALCKANAILEAKLEEEEKKCYSLDMRCRALENARIKTENDREMFELTVRETIKRLDNITNPDADEWWSSCGGIDSLMMMLGTVGDHKECDRIKSMLKQVIVDPMAYERNYLHMGVCDDTTLMSTSKDELTMATTCNDGDDTTV